MSLEAYGNSTAAAFEPDDVIVHAGAARVSPHQSGPVHVAGNGYGNRRSLSPTAIGVTVAVHLVLAAGLFQLGAQYIKQDKPRIIAMDLNPAAPPPAPAEPPPPSPPQQVAAVVPPIVLPRPAPIEVAVEQDIEPLPVQVPVSAAPRPVEAPPAPNPPAAAAAAPPRLVDAGNLGTQMVSGRPPRYPVESRRKHEQGTVVLSITLGLDGRVANIAVSRSSGFARLDDAAMDAVRRWRWSPTLRDGQPVMVRGAVEIPFQLQERA